MGRSEEVFVKGKISQNVLVFAFTGVGLSSLLPIASVREPASRSSFAGSRAKAKANNAVEHEQEAIELYPGKRVIKIIKISGKLYRCNLYIQKCLVDFTAHLKYNQ